MIRATPAEAGLLQRLRLRAGRMVAERLRQSGRRKRRGRDEWHSPAALWPDFTDDTGI